MLSNVKMRAASEKNGSHSVDLADLWGRYDMIRFVQNQYRSQNICPNPESGLLIMSPPGIQAGHRSSVHPAVEPELQGRVHALVPAPDPPAVVCAPAVGPGEVGLGPVFFIYFSKFHTFSKNV